MSSQELYFEDLYVKKKVLLNLHFKQVGSYEWWHPYLKDSDSITFDIKTDPISALIGKMYRKGYAKGSEDSKVSSNY